MAVTISNRGGFSQTSSVSTHTLSLAVSAGTNRKIVFVVLRDSSTTITGATWDGNAATNVAGATIVNTTDSLTQAATYYYDVGDGVGAATYDIVVTTSGNTANIDIYGWQLQDAVAGAPEDADETEWTTASQGATLTLTCTAGAALLAAANTSSAAQTWTWTGDVTERYESDPTNHTPSAADVVVGSAADYSATATVSTAGAGNKVLVATSWAAAAGPTITTQPTAQTARINGESAGPIATFTVAATSSGGSLVYDWELEDGVASGVYANVADGSGATWTGVTGTSLVGTFTATTLTGRRVRCNVTDDNGTTTTNAVALTVLAGPVTTASSSATSGAGVGTLTYHSDDALTTNGELLLWTVTSRGRSFYIVTRPA